MFDINELAAMQVGITCEKCGVEVISKEWRRERFGHIELSTPCTHIWYLKGIPSRMALILGIPAKQLEEIVYFAAHVVLRESDPNVSTVLKKKDFLDEATAREKFVACIESFKDSIDTERWRHQEASPRGQPRRDLRRSQQHRQNL